ncbi:unnamed protein product [Enterobius vermicularis]|uniref:GLOBIN domain-containing protein n=1 Tax=Enterobius vermicularis TaxID=51028 RepID=A0A0N4VJW6_ENTVE|nr:unnamed protein product [Enterobius vermicularis]
MGSGSSVAAPQREVSHVSRGKPAEETKTATHEFDSCLPYTNFRDLFTLKNYWKVVRRNERESGKALVSKYLKSNPDNKKLYERLKNINLATVDSSTVDPGFEKVSAAYLKVFDEVITAVEEKPADVSEACERLKGIGKMHKTKVSSMDAGDFQKLEEPFLNMINDVLQDRYNEKVDTLFRKFFQFCLKYILEGYNS